MSDISMCLDHECPMKLKCYRYTAPVNEYRQSYVTESPRAGDECTDFWDNKGRWLDKKFIENGNKDKI